MACGGCSQRREAIVSAAIALAEGRGADVKAELHKFKKSATEDVERLRAQARQRIAGFARRGAGSARTTKGR